MTVPEGKVLRTGTSDLEAAREAVRKKLEQLYSEFSTTEAAKQRVVNFKTAQQLLIENLTEEQGTV